MIRNGVLVANVFGDVAEDIWKIPSETRLIEPSTGQAGEGLHFIVGLVPVNLLHA